MDLFNEGSRCRKCSCEKVHSFYFGPGDHRSERRLAEMSYLEPGESYIVRRCDRCRNQWRERPLDQATPLEIAQRAAQAKKDAEIEAMDPR